MYTFRIVKPVGERLIRLASYITLMIKILYPAACFITKPLRDNFIYIKFDWSDGLCTKDSDEPKTFEVAGVDRSFCPAKAWIEGNEVVLSCPEVPVPCWVHYAFGEYPVEANFGKRGRFAGCFFLKNKLI